jgi:hypothetical protein
LSHVGAVASIKNESQHTSSLIIPDPKTLTLKVGHISPNVAVQGVDHHLAVRWSGDFHAAIDQTGSRRSALPGIVLADRLGLGQEVGQDASVELFLTDHSSLQ